MNWLTKGEFFLPNTSVNELKRRYDYEKKAKPKLRLLSAILRKEGKSLDNISFSLQKPKTTIHDWLKRIESENLNNIYDIKQSGKPSRLTKEQKEKLKKILINSPMKQDIPFVLWTTSLVQYLINKLFNVLYKPRNVEYLVKELGFTLQKPRQKHKKANKNAQEEFKKNFKKKFKTALTVDLRSSVLMKRIL